MNYFDKLPIISYDNNLARNLLARARFTQNTMNNKAAYYPYTIKDGQRADSLSDDYYNSPGYEWLIYFANDIIDPYYDLPMTEDNFYNHIVSKYGTYENAMRKILYYRHDWANALDERLTIAEFNALSFAYKKYYDPVLDYNLQPASYKRNSEDWVASTNKTIALTLTSVTGTFLFDEEVRINNSNYGTVTYVDTGVVYLQHIVGAFTAGATVTGVTSGATATIDTEGVTTLSVNIQDGTVAGKPDERAFWSPVTAFQYEEEENAKRKEIRLMDVRHKSTADDTLRQVLKSK
jgi:hypothetical protein